MSAPELIPHLFRTEFRKITAVLCKFLGIGQLETAEDLASETFLADLETWTYQGLPPEPRAWLYAVAKNKARNHLRRQRLLHGKITSDLQQAPTPTEEAEIDLSDQHISDSQLQMLFAICHPTLSPAAQVGLALRVLCGFGISEIADAFLTTRETINKRLGRAREKLRIGQVPIVFPPEPERSRRLEMVCRTLYLLFSEGYYSESREPVLREDLCLEAMRLTRFLLENAGTNRPDVHALFALMCFQASRFGSRKNELGEMVLYEDQDQGRWNQELITQGAWHLHQAARGERLSKYHLEAAIASWHTRKTDTREKWENILRLYNHLLKIEYSPVAALNRTYALFRAKSREEAIAEALKLNLQHNHFYFTLLGELYTGLDDHQARRHLEKALALAKTERERKTIREKLHRLS
ncbi:MAG: RNA polymerase sigma factor [Flavisolibacter sp.]